MAEDPFLISYKTLRKAIGWMGISLPFLLMAGSLLFGNCSFFQASISHYYYTVVGDLFVGLLVAIGIFLITYKGYDVGDDTSTTIAGVFAIFVALFPTDNNPDPECTCRTLPLITLRVGLHYFSAAVFFITLAYICFFRFTKSTNKNTREKKIRNNVYKTCGIVIVSCVVLIGAIGFIPPLTKFFEPFHPTFWLEWTGLFAFGYSWLIKGEAFFKDKPVLSD